MMQNPWMSMSVGLLKGMPVLVDLAGQVTALDALLRELLALPPTTPEKGRRTPANALAFLYWRVDRALSEIREHHADSLRRTIANSHGPVGPLAWPSGLLAYADLAEYALGGLSVIHDEGIPGPPGPRPVLPELPFPHRWSPTRYAIAVDWLKVQITLPLLNELAVAAVQDLARLRRGTVLPPEEVRQRRERRIARMAVFRHDYRMKADPALVLAAMAQLKDDRVVRSVDGFAKLSLIAKKVPFQRTKLIHLLAPLQVLEYVVKGPRGGFRITARGFTLNRLQ